MYCSCFISSSVDRHLGCVYFLAVVKSAAMNTGYMCLLELWFSQGICPVVELLGRIVVLFLVFKEITTLSSIVHTCVLSCFSRVQLCVTLPGSSVHGILQARILDWVAISSSRGLSQSRDWTQVSCAVGRLFTNGASREAPCPLICLFPEENKHCLLSVSVGSPSMDSAKCKWRIFSAEPVDTEGWL